MASCISRLWGMYNVPTVAEDLLAITDKALALDPNLSEAHAARGEALANSGRRAEAAAAFEAALELDPNSFDASLSYARFCVTEGKLEKADRVLPARPRDPARRFAGPDAPPDRLPLRRDAWRNRKNMAGSA